jgi:hypothetical protein
MKPGFALLFSMEGVSLLKRAAGGWLTAATADFTTGDPAEAAADLRRQSEDFGEAPLACKLVIPNEQIRYLSVETGETDADSRMDAVQAALEGATPYPLDELAYDLCADGPVTHVAAVAIETLAEAESFAASNGFLPVSFVASPGPNPFLGEPFFGTARAIRGTDVEPDGVAVIVTGTAERPAPREEDASGTGPASLTIPPAPQELTPEPAPAEEVPAAAPVSEASEAKQEDLAPSPAPEQEDIKEDAEPEPLNSDAAKPDAGDAPGPLAAKAQQAESSLEERKPPKEEELPEVQPESAPAAKDTQGPSADPSDAAKEDTAEKKPDSAEPGQPPVSGFSSRRRKGAPAPSGPGPVVSAVPGSAASAAAAATLTAAKPKGSAQPPVPPLKTLQSPSGPASPLPSAPPPLAGATPARPLPAANSKAPATQPSAPSAMKTAQTIPGALPASDVPAAGKSRRLGLVLTALLILGMAGTAVWTLIAPGDLPPAGEAAIQEQQDVEEQPLDSAEAPPEADAEDTIVVTEAEAEAEAEAETAAADAPVQPEVQAADRPDAPAAGADQAADADLAGEPLPEQPQDASGLVLSALPDLEAPAAPGEPLETDPAGTELSEAARYAATGIWQTPPRSPELAPVVDLDRLYVASIDHTNLSQDAVALPPASRTATDTAPEGLSSPAQPGREFDLDARGLVTATPEGTLNPDGIMIYLGKPPVVPPRTPDRPDPAAEAAAIEAARLSVLSQKRPRLRPEGLVEQAERARLGGLSRAEFGALRPKMRPDSLKTAEQESQPPTAQAVASSVVPRKRPSNFANIVSRARSSTASAAAAASAAPVASVAPATVTPSIPTSASVARQATQENALNLRKINLIGVFGTPSNRRALVRTSSGSYRNLQVGDRLDGGRVVAIGDSELRYEKGGRNLTLRIPNG